MKDYAIILDEKQAKRVVPSTWLTEDSKVLLWPSDPSFDIKKGIVECTKPEKGWKRFKITKVIKYEDSYTNAIEQMNINQLEDMSDPSDKEKLKRSRNTRNKKKTNDDYVTPPLTKKRRIKDVDNNTSNSTTGSTESDTEENAIQTNGPSCPKSLSVNYDPLETHYVDLPMNENDSHLQENDESTPITNVESMASTSSTNRLEKKIEEVLKNQNRVLSLVRVLNVKVDMNTKAIQNLEKKSVSNITSDGNVSQKDLKILNEYFPIDGNPEGKRVMDEVEEKLAEKSFVKLVVTQQIMQLIDVFYKIKRMINIGGINANDLIQKIMANFFKDEVLMEYSFKGQKKNEKGERNKSFSLLKINSCINEATKASFPKVTDTEVKTSISTWLDNAKTRAKRQNATSKKTPFLPLDLDDDDNEDDEN